MQHCNLIQFLFDLYIEQVTSGLQLKWNNILSYYIVILMSCILTPRKLHKFDPTPFLLTKFFLLSLKKALPIDQS